jgi:hypothetical protein
MNKNGRLIPPNIQQVEHLPKDLWVEINAAGSGVLMNIRVPGFYLDNLIKISEEGKPMIRGVMKLKGLRETRTLQGSKKRSMPRAQNATYLDIFILGKERDRLDKEIIIIDKRKTSMSRRLDEIAIEMKSLEEAENRGKRTSPGKSKRCPAKGWKTMAMTY